MGVKRQLVFTCYHSVNQSDENVDMKLIIMYLIEDITFMKDETQTCDCLAAEQFCWTFDDFW